jgi:hypothetical protein
MVCTSTNAASTIVFICNGPQIASELQMVPSCQAKLSVCICQPSNPAFSLLLVHQMLRLTIYHTCLFYLSYVLCTPFVPKFFPNSLPQTHIHSLPPLPHHN